MEKRLLGLGAPDLANLRQGRDGLRTHMFYIDKLLQEREWLAGPPPVAGRFRGRGAPVGDRLLRRHALAGLPGGEDLVHEAEIPARVSGRCWRTAGRAWRPPGTMTISTSRRPEAADPEPGRRLGFDTCRFTPIDRGLAGRRAAAEFVDAGRHGEMGWMAETAERRAHPRAMWADARSAIVLGMNYGPDHDPLAVLERKDRGRDQRLCPGRRLSRADQGPAEGARRLQCRFGGELKVFVDTAPLLEKPLAERGGPGLAGQAHQPGLPRVRLLAVPGSILTTLELAGRAERRHCGTCRACLDVCPTKAFPAPYQLDARRCISYLTIELKGPIPREFRAALGNRIYGCDDCLAVCPWNKFAPVGAEQKLRGPRGPARAVAGRSAAPGRRRVPRPVRQARSSGSAATGSCRNVLYAIGNSGDPALAEVAT